MGPMPVHLKVRACCFQNEVKLLLELLPKYHAHVERYPHTLLIKFYGLHRVVPLNGSKVQTLGHTHTLSVLQSLPVTAVCTALLIRSICQSCLLRMTACSFPLSYP